MSAELPEMNTQQTRAVTCQLCRHATGNARNKALRGPVSWNIWQKVPGRCTRSNKWHPGRPSSDPRTSRLPPE
jgi:hypothetical protein